MNVTRAASFTGIDVTSSLPPTLSLSSPHDSSCYGAGFGAADNNLSSHSIEEGCEPESEIERACRQPHDPDMVIVDLPPIFVQNHVRVEKGASSHVGYIFKVSCGQGGGREGRGRRWEKGGGGGEGRGNTKAVGCSVGTMYHTANYATLPVESVLRDFSNVDSLRSVLTLI